MTEPKICIKCRWHTWVRGKDYCIHPLTPVDAITGEAGDMCQRVRDSHYIYPVAGGERYLCGELGRLYEEATA